MKIRRECSQVKGAAHHGMQSAHALMPSPLSSSLQNSHLHFFPTTAASDRVTLLTGKQPDLAMIKGKGKEIFKDRPTVHGFEVSPQYSTWRKGVDGVDSRGRSRDGVPSG